MSKVTNFQTCLHFWIWRETGKIYVFEVASILISVYVTPSNIEKQVYQRCYAIIWNGVLETKQISAYSRISKEMVNKSSQYQ